MIDRMLRKKDVLTATGWSHATLDRQEKAGNFPKRRQLGPNSVGWLAREVKAWQQERPVKQLGSNAPECLRIGCKT